MIRLKKSTLTCVAAASMASACLIGADRLPAAASAHVAPAPKAAVVASQPATAEQERYTGANLWADTGPDIDDVQQTDIGDCYFDAAMAAVAYTQPARIMSALSYDQAAGEFTVHLNNYAEGRDYIPGTHGDGKPWPLGGSVVPETVVVTQQDVKDDIRAGGASVLDDGKPGYIWPAVMEAAYAKMLLSLYPDHPAAKEAAVTVAAGLRIAEAANPENSLWSGGDVDQGMASVTGQTGAYAPAELSSCDLIAAALANHQPVTMGTAPSKQAIQDQLVFNHQYTVIAVAKDASGTVKLTVRNPWGRNDGVPGVADQASGAVTVDLRQALAHKVIGSFDIGPAPLS